MNVCIEDAAIYILWHIIAFPLDGSIAQSVLVSVPDTPADLYSMGTFYTESVWHVIASHWLTTLQYILEHYTKANTDAQKDKPLDLVLLFQHSNEG